MNAVDVESIIICRLPSVHRLAAALHSCGKLPSSDFAKGDLITTGRQWGRGFSRGVRGLV